MKFSLQHLASQASLVSLLILQGASPVDAHYGFPLVIINGIASAWWEYVRPTGLDSFGGQWFPNYDWFTEPQVCGVNGTKTGHRTKTAVVEAGSRVDFLAFAATYVEGYIEPREFNRGDGVGHPGPGQFYLSKAPGAIEDYEGDGEWFKIGLSGASDGQHWDSDGQASLNVTIPKTTPPGKYLLRVEHFNIQPYYNQTQMYVNCAQIEITGPGGGTPGPTIKFPGGYDPKDPGIWIPRSMYQPYKPSELLKNYKGPGPAVWKG
ncbi:fungal cellulose binding domain-containing protein [Dendryphion nanum]|uniref:lytic cellulose monooxygenase (C4-dehydrogenating) n=1 Tax=Dendryphion nanum TaxID=256645 RepID=A0A9P9DEX8_9PLEO|nr:fungal cellulose binding domain-containing protein [Dendryphion nanum]